eukprot:Pompholyxophrys_punicea_v1_NODE_1182_length_882_cov_2.108827.p3 type:complete len:111 gc:universal NODE_1182_length_882_cov_2.108827:371-39(-)
MFPDGGGTQMGRRTRPKACMRKTSLLVGRSMRQTESSGISVPSVRTPTLTTTSTSPLLMASFRRARSSFGVSSVMVQALTPFFLKSSQTLWAWALLTQKATAFSPECLDL